MKYLILWSGNIRGARKAVIDSEPAHLVGRQALLDLKEAGFEAIPHANWVLVNQGANQWEPIFTTQGVDNYIATHEPLMHE